MIETRAILAQWGRLLRAQAHVLLLWTTLLTATGTAIDVWGAGDMRSNWPFNLLATFGNFLAISAVLRANGAHNAWGRPGRTASFIGVSLLSGIPIFVGLLLLIIPGLFLSARWILSYPLVIGEGLRTVEALSESWRRTRVSVGPLMLAVALSSLPMVLGVVWSAFSYSDYEPRGIGNLVATNLLMASGMVSGWILAVAAHLHLQDGEATDLHAFPASVGAAE